MPTKEELAKFSIRSSVTESAAATFTETMFNTNVGVEASHMFVMTGLWFYIDPGVVGNADEPSVQLCYAAQTALITPENPDWLAGVVARADLSTNGKTIFPMTYYFAYNDFPIAHQALYLGLHSVGAAVAAFAAVKLEGYLKKVSSNEFFRIARFR